MATYKAKLVNKEKSTGKKVGTAVIRKPIKLRIKIKQPTAPRKTKGSRYV